MTNRERWLLIRPIRHGTLAGYGRRCRCLKCRLASHAYKRAWDQRKGRAA